MSQNQQKTGIETFHFYQICSGNDTGQSQEHEGRMNGAYKEREQNEQNRRYMEKMRELKRYNVIKALNGRI